MEKTPSQNLRIPWIDVAKGIGIILIVWGHVLRTGSFRTYLYAFNVPIFFLLIGYTLKCDIKPLDFIKKRFMQTMIPYYIWSLFSIFIFLLMLKFITLDTSEASTSIVKNVLGMLYANSRTIYMKWNIPLWFIPCMNIVSICVFLIEKLLDKVRKWKNMGRIMAIVVFATIGLLLPVCGDYKLPFQFESGVYMISFVEIGFFMKERRIIERIWAWGKINVFLTIALMIFLSIVLIKINGFAEIREYNYGKYPVLFLMYSCMLSVVLMILSYKLKDCTVFSEIGRISFSILLLHKFPIVFFQSVVPFSKKILLKPDSLEGMLCSIFVMLITLIICEYLTRIISHFAPWAIGYKSKGKI